MPTFWSGILLILIFSAYPSCTVSSDGICWNRIPCLPAITLGLVGAGFIVRVVRNSMLEVINETYIATLRAKGMSWKEL